MQDPTPQNAVPNVMRADRRRIIILGVGFVLCSAFIQVRPALLCLIGMFFFGGGLVVELVICLGKGLARWRKSTRWWMMPALACLALLLTAPLDFRLGMIIADLEFRSHIPDYTKIVDDIKSGAIPSTQQYGVIQAKPMPSNVKIIMGASCPDHQAVVVFLVGTGFPLIHTGYLYKGYSDTNSCFKTDMTQKWNLRHVQGDWYRFND